MVQTRSGAGMPSTPPRGDDQDQVPDQIVVDTQGQPLENQSSRILEPSQTPRQTPQVYIAGTIPSRLTLERLPSLPRNFRPSEFAFMPQPDFESAREPSDPSKDDDETKAEVPQKTGAEQLLSSGDRRRSRFHSAACCYYERGRESNSHPLCGSLAAHYGRLSIYLSKSLEREQE